MQIMNGEKTMIKKSTGLLWITVLFLSSLFITNVAAATDDLLAKGNVFAFEISQDVGALWAKKTIRTKCRITILEHNSKGTKLETSFDPFPEWNTMSNKQRKNMYFYYPQPKTTGLSPGGDGIFSLESGVTRWKMTSEYNKLFKKNRIQVKKFSKEGDKWRQVRTDQLMTADAMVFDLVGFIFAMMTNKDIVLHKGEIYIWENYLKRLVQLKATTARDTVQVKAYYEGEQIFTFLLDSGNKLPRLLEFNNGLKVKFVSYKTGEMIRAELEQERKRIAAEKERHRDEQERKRIAAEQERRRVEQERKKIAAEKERRRIEREKKEKAAEEKFNSGTEKYTHSKSFSQSWQYLILGCLKNKIDIDDLTKHDHLKIELDHNEQLHLVSRGEKIFSIPSDSPDNTGKCLLQIVLPSKCVGGTQDCRLISAFLENNENRWAEIYTTYSE